jgi:transcriptional regulator of acetoin/glycerol metabolism
MTTNPTTIPTLPSASTGQLPARAQPTLVRWVHPGRRLLALDGRRPVVVGRDEACDLVLAGGEISRRHAEFRVDGPIAAVRDLGSRNGVQVNGIHQADAPLAIGDVVRCGEWIGVVGADDAAAAATAGAGFREIAPAWFGGAALAAAAEPARRLATTLPIVVQGETGTGKEGMARAIHTWSGRPGPLVAINCAALPTELAEAELFGYRRGAFTGANADSPGLFRSAAGGSLFLDEILDLPMALQAKLLRVLEEGRVRGLGDTRDTAVDVRIIAATQEPLAAAVAEGRFRADLHARLDGLTVVLPPLRERREDVAPLFAELLRAHAAARPPAVEPKLIEALCVYDWPLNVRELVLLTRRLVGMHGHEGLLRKAFLPDRLLARRPDSPRPGGGARPARTPTDHEAEFEAFIDALRDHGGSVARAAAAIGVSRARAYRLLSARPDFSLDDVRRG